MKTIHQEFEPTQQGLNPADHPVVRDMAVDPTVAYAQEVRLLRQRVAELEAELAATKTVHAAQAGNDPARPPPPLTSIDFAPASGPEYGASEFTESAAPAVQPTNETTPVVAESEPGFAQAWSAENEVTSFEERIAEKAFFQASTVDEESRSWLLDK